MDDIDRANEYVARLNDEALSQRVHYSGHSAERHADNTGESVTIQDRQGLVWGIYEAEV